MASSANMMAAAAALALMVAAFAISADAQIFGVCRVSFDEIQTCEPAVTRGNPKPPTSVCCSVLRKADLPCLCGYKTSSFIPSTVDINLAMALPSKCSLQLPARC